MAKQPRMRIKEGKYRLNGIAYADHEVELEEVDDNTQDTLMSISEENAEPNLVETSDGRLIIEMKPSRTCNVCDTGFISANDLKMHKLTCTDKTEEFKDVLEMEKQAAMIAQPGEEFFKYCNPNPDNPCYCCGEDTSTAHVGHIKCNYCPKSFKAYEYMEKHLAAVHSESDNFACPQCNAKCSTQEVLTEHLATHSEGKPFSCLRCGKDFTRKYHLERHLTHSRCGDAPKQTLPCEVCGKEFTRLDNLREHLRFHMGQGSRKRDYQCPYCPKSFYGSSLLNIHIRTHTGEKPFPCDLCCKSFPSTGALRKHRRSHTGERPYRCDQCPATFAARETLNRHRKTHTGEKPHQCTVCEKRFIQATQLRSHMFHHTGENGFACEICGAAFNRKTRLDEHIRFVHNHEAALRCVICSKDFMRKEDLSRHMDCHSDVKNFACPECDKHFVSKIAMRLHLRTHTIEDPSICLVCNRRFIRQDCLVRHMRTKHREHYKGSLMESSVESNTTNAPFPEEEHTVLLEVEETSEEPEKDPQVLEIDGEVYQITPVEDIQIVQISSSTVNVKRENTQDVKVLEVIEISPPMKSKPKMPTCEEKSNPITPTCEEKSKTKTPTSEEKSKPKMPTSEEKRNKKTGSGIKVPEVNGFSRKDIYKPGIKGLEVLEVIEIPPPSDSKQKLDLVEKKQNRQQVPKQTRVIATAKEVAEALAQPLLIPMEEHPFEQEPVPLSKNKKNKKRKRLAENAELQPGASRIKIERFEDSTPIFLGDETLKRKISELLCLLIDEDMLTEFGWPLAPVERVLSNVIVRCGHKPACDEDTGDYTTRMRENTKILFSLTMDDNNIKTLLNNHTVDEVIMNVLKNK